MEKIIQQFISEHQHLDLAKVSLLLSKHPELPKEFILNQINGRKKAKQKFPELLEDETFHFPSETAISQASSAITALYKSTLLKGSSITDLCGGMGIDSYYFSKNFDQVDFVEQNEELFEISKKNLQNNASARVNFYCTDANSYLKTLQENRDVIYLDPDRRAQKYKAFKIEECSPNLLELLPEIWEHTEHCLVKYSPMLDLKKAISQLEFCKQVWVVSVNNECKEILFYLKKGTVKEALISAVNIKKEEIEQFDFYFSNEENLQVEFENSSTYLYDPNTSILKSGAFKSIAKQYGLKKLDVNTHLYTSEEQIPKFQGRVFKVIEETNLKQLKGKKANVISKNYPLKVDQIKSKFKIKDGGDLFLIAFTQSGNRKKILSAVLIN